MEVDNTTGGQQSDNMTPPFLFVVQAFLDALQ